jgi:pyrroline-5-carboxylate reductase
MKIGFIGAGNMAEAIIAGLLRKKIVTSSSITACDVSSQRLKVMQSRYRLKASPSLQVLAQQSDVIVLAVKPQQMKEVLGELKKEITPRHLVLSIAAGLDIPFFAKYLGQVRLIRLMPNTPALIEKGATAFFMNTACKKSDKKIVESIFSSIGIVMEVKKEKLLDAVTAVSGSGPAYVYSFINALVQAGIRVGLSQDVARKLVEQTVIGAAELLQQSQEDPESLIAKVASKGGTTEAGLKILRKKKFDSMILETVKAAAKRAAQLRQFS